jgi:hypothetical protein
VKTIQTLLVRAFAGFCLLLVGAALVGEQRAEAGAPWFGCPASTSGGAGTPICPGANGIGSTCTIPAVCWMDYWNVPQCQCITWYYPGYPPYMPPNSYCTCKQI